MNECEDCDRMDCRERGCIAPVLQKIIAPWSGPLVDQLNKHQADPAFHAYTCPGDYNECENQRELVATESGWVCKCGKYTQDWV